MNYVPGFSNYLQHFATGGEAQGLPTEQPVQAVPATDAIDPMLVAYYKKLGLDPATISTLDPATMKQMAYNARQDAYDAAQRAEMQRTGSLQKVGSTYAETHPEDYYNTFGTIPINSLGKSRYGIDEKTWGTDTAQGAEGIKYLTPDANATYTLYSPRSGQTLGTGTGAEGLLSLAQLANQQTLNKDRKADWQLMQVPAAGGTPEMLGSNLYNTNLSGFGKIIATALPIATSFIPGLNALGAIAAGAGAGGLSAAMKEQNILKGALLGGATAGALRIPVGGGQTVGGAIGNAIGKVPVLGDAARAIGDVIPGATGQSFVDATGSIVVPATKAIAPAVVNALAQSGVQGALNTVGPAPRRPDYGDKVEPDQPAEDAIVVTGAKTPPPPIGGLLASTIAGSAPSLNAPTTPTTTTQPPAEKKTTLSDIADYMNLAGLGIGALGSLFGGNNASQANRPYAGAGTGNIGSVFNAQLPGANLPGLSGVGGARTAADLGQQGLNSPQDYYRYGYGPEQSFFSNVKPSAPNTSKAYTGYAKGGFAVEGPGDGREDKIPAMLSDGEYVMDAETVAMLGNGSNKAGAEMLDKFRVNLRKHKGREMVRGKFSKNAKRPEQYLAGGRA